MNIRKFEYITEDNSILVKKIKPNFRVLGPKVGPLMKEISGSLAKYSQDDIKNLEEKGSVVLELSNGSFELTLSDVEIQSEDIPGWSVASDDGITVALDITITEELQKLGIAREFVNRIQNQRKGKDLQLTDRINVQVSSDEYWDEAVKEHSEYISNETLTNELSVVNELSGGEELEINGHNGKLLIELATS